MKNRLICQTALVVFSLCGVLPAQEWHRRWSSAGSNWHERWINLANQSDSMLPEEKFELLGRGLGVGSKGDQMTKPELEVYETLQNILLKTPGHADYYHKEIQRIMDEHVQGTGRGVHQRGLAFTVLKHLPSPETVKVLGELLFDERNPWEGGDFLDTGPPWTNSQHASMALTRLGISKAPVRNGSERAGFEPSDIHTWQLWYEQVKAGTRTFSFEGDDTILSLSGPVSVALDGPAPRMERRTAAGGAEEGNAPTGQSRWSWMILAALLIGIVGLPAVRWMKRS